MDAKDRAILGLTLSWGLTAKHAAALRLYAASPEYYAAGALIRTASAAPRMKLMLSGWASELRVLHDGRTQIFSFVICGDLVLSRSAAALDVCSLVALTPVTCIDTSRTIARAPLWDREELQCAMDRALAVTSERRYGLLRRLRLRSRLARTADLLLELQDRLARVGLVTSAGFEMPLTHQQMADASGLTAGQVRRSLQYLEAKHLAVLRSGEVMTLDEAALQALRKS